MSEDDIVVPAAKELEDLVTGSEIARRIGMSRQRVHQFAAQPDFPQALGRLGPAKIWRWSDIRNWLHTVGRAPAVENTSTTDPPRPRNRTA